MQPLTTREKLYDYIRVADDKKIKAIYNLLENEIEEINEWWQNKVVTTELDKRYKLEETKAHLKQLGNAKSRK